MEVAEISVVLMYHDVRHEAVISYDVSLSTFAAHLNVILEQKHAAKPDIGPVELSFDDGLASHHELVLPELISRGLEATFFVAPGLIGKQGFMTWAQVRNLVSHGMTIGSHSLTHGNLALLSPADVRRELQRSKEVLEDELGIPVCDLALPGGFLPAHVRRQAANAGYASVFTSSPWNWNGHSMLVPRVCIREIVDSDEMRRIISMHFSGYVMRERLRYAVRAAIGPRPYLWIRGMLQGSSW
jgi:peptidoglycan/xylan/chitin deacetylase (PgdA/CDA1 family)